jgi:hypothetical protein
MTPVKTDQKSYRRTRGALLAEAVSDWRRGLLRLRDLFFFPEHLMEFQALDTNLATPVEALSYPHYACACAFNTPLQQDLISRVEMMSGRVDARSGGRHVESADVGRASGSKKIDSERDNYGAALFTQLIKIFQLQILCLFAEGLKDCAHNSDSSTNFCAVSLRIFA